MCEERGRVLAGLVAHLRDIDLAEDVLQDAYVAALQRWRLEGVPTHPRAWLFQTARRRAIDRIRRDRNFADKRAQLAIDEALERELASDEGEEHVVDERLRMLFTCCYPALAQPARVALTLKTLGRLTTSEIARAFLVPETTMAQRLVRAKRKIKAANIPYRVPPPHLWSERLDSVLAVVYPIFNEGYSATQGDELTRADLCDEAIRLGRMLTELAPAEPEAAGLLALMLLHDSRRAARTDARGELKTLEDQDRARWDAERIQEGLRHLERAQSTSSSGPYLIQAAVSAAHARAPSYEATDWREITRLYERLYEFQPSPIVRLNAVVALSFARGPRAALDGLDELQLEGSLEHYQPYYAARADVLRRCGRPDAAANAYRRALALSGNATERRFLEHRLREVLN